MEPIEQHPAAAKEETDIPASTEIDKWQQALVAESIEVLPEEKTVDPVNAPVTPQAAEAVQPVIPLAAEADVQVR